MNIKKENEKDKIKCSCGSCDFVVYITYIIDDARIYCSKCKKDFGGGEPQ